jgi:hypothetical protein
MLSIISYLISLFVFFGISLIIYLQLLNIELI